MTRCWRLRKLASPTLVVGALPEHVERSLDPGLDGFNELANLKREDEAFLTVTRKHSA